MVIKRMIGSEAIAREIGRHSHDVHGQREKNMDSSFFMFGPGIWDGLDADEVKRDR